MVELGLKSGIRAYPSKVVGPIKPPTIYSTPPIFSNKFHEIILTSIFL